MKAFFLAVLIGALSALQAAEHRVHVDGKDGAFRTISHAVAAASDGDTVFVSAGTYKESVLIRASINLIGEGPQFVTVAPETANHAVTVASSGYTVNIRGMTITAESHGVVIQANNTVLLENVIVTDCAYAGVYHYAAASSVTLRNCTIANNKGPGLLFIPTTGGAIYLYDCILFGNEGNSGREGNGYQIRTDGAAYVWASALHWNGPSLVDRSQPQGYLAFAAQLDPRFLDYTNRNYMLNPNSQSRNVGSAALRDPDGSRVDLGAYGGPNAGPFWPYPLRGPVISEHSVASNKVITVQGEVIKIRAKATTR